MDLNTVVIDIDGVVAPHSNRKFYASYIMDIVHCLKSSCKKPPKEILQAIKEFKKEKQKGLFNFVYSLTKNKQEFDNFTDSLLKRTKYRHIVYAPVVRDAFLKTLENRKIIILTDNLKEHANQIIYRTTGISSHKNLSVYGVEDSLKDGKFNPKNSENGMKIFLENLRLSPENCRLLDDKEQNLKKAKSLGMEAVRVNSHADLLNALNGLDKPILSPVQKMPKALKNLCLLRHKGRG